MVKSEDAKKLMCPMTYATVEKDLDANFHYEENGELKTVNVKIKLPVKMNAACQTNQCMMWIYDDNNLDYGMCGLIKK